MPPSLSIRSSRGGVGRGSKYTRSSQANSRDFAFANFVTPSPHKRSSSSGVKLWKGREGGGGRGRGEGGGRGSRGDVIIEIRTGVCRVKRFVGGFDKENNSHAIQTTVPQAYEATISTSRPPTPKNKKCALPLPLPHPSLPGKTTTQKPPPPQLPNDARPRENSRSSPCLS